VDAAKAIASRFRGQQNKILLGRVVDPDSMGCLVRIRGKKKKKRKKKS
jgi:hypothetical protein